VATSPQSTVSAVIFPHVRKVAGVAFRALTTSRDDVAANTVSLARVNRRRAVSARIIDLVRNEFDVRLTNARAVTAKMVSLKTCRTVRLSEMVSPNNLVPTGPPVERKLSVAVGFNSSQPNPALPEFGAMLRNRPVFIDFFPETFIRRSVQRHERTNLAQKGRCKTRYGRL
jgi:hypothetical protein